MTHVVMLAMSLFDEIGADNLCIGFGIGKFFSYIAVLKIFLGMSPSKVKAVSAFHALTNLDASSFLSGISKKSDFEKWFI